MKKNGVPSTKCPCIKRCHKPYRDSDFGDIWQLDPNQGCVAINLTSTSNQPAPIVAPRPATQATTNGAPRRVAASNQWLSVELQILVGLKHQEFERALHNHPRERMCVANQHSVDIKVGMKTANINQKAPMIHKKWKKLMIDFKKVFDY